MYLALININLVMECNFLSAFGMVLKDNVSIDAVMRHMEVANASSLVVLRQLLDDCNKKRR